MEKSQAIAFYTILVICMIYLGSAAYAPILPPYKQEKDGVIVAFIFWGLALFMIILGFIAFKYIN